VFFCESEKQLDQKFQNQRSHQCVSDSKSDFTYSIKAYL